MKSYDVKDLPVMKVHCKTCPFKPNERSHWQNVPLCNTVIERCLSSMNEQICHGTEGVKRKPNNLCKGYQDFKSDIFKRF